MQKPQDCFILLEDGAVQQHSLKQEAMWELVMFTMKED